MIPILFLAADPTDASRLRLGEEIREIQEKLQLAKLRDQFTLHQRMSVRPSDISQAMLDVDPEIVHFSGHGTSNGALCFENKIGETHLVEPEALAALFEQFTSNVKCVILNACYSIAQAEAIAKNIQYVIGMNQAIGDKAAISFSVGFYQALGAGRSVEEAYKLGCVQIRLQNIPEHLTPVLIKKNPFAPILAHKRYQFPEDYYAFTMRKNRTSSSDKLDRQRIGLVALAGRDTSWGFLALIESVGSVDYAVQTTSAAAQTIREFVEQFMGQEVLLRELDPKFFIEMCVKFADLGAKQFLQNIPGGVHCGTKMAIAIRVNKDVYVACVGECGALLRWKVADNDYYRNVRNPSLFTVEQPNATTMDAPIGHLLLEDDKPVVLSPNMPPIGGEINIEPVKFLLNEVTDFVILTSHRIHINDQHTQRMIEQIASQTTMYGIAQYICETEGTDYEECMAVAMYRGGQL